MSAPLDLVAARRLLVHARHAGAGLLLESEGMALLDAIGIATPRRVVLADAEAAARLLDTPFPVGRVVLKALAPGVFHKTEAGAVRILPARRDAVIAGIEAMARRLDGAPIAGYLLEHHVAYEPSFGREFLLGLRWTPDFGPVVTLGAGGVHTELLAAALREDEALAVFAPGLIRDGAIEAAIERVAATRLATKSRRGRPPILPTAALVDAVRRFLALAEALCPELLLEFEANPLVVSDGRLVALDAFARLAPPGGPVVAADAPRPTEKIGRLLEPKTIALIGVSDSSMNPGRIMLRNILRAGFDRERLAIVKPRRDLIDGVRCVPSLSALVALHEFSAHGGRADLIVLAVSAAASAELLEEIAREHRAESVILIPAGLEEREGSRPIVSRMRAALDLARAAPWRGPVVNGGNCLGVRSVPGGYNTLYVPEHKLPLPMGPPDPVALIGGSGAFAAARSSRLMRVNPVYTIAIGNQMDLTVADYMQYLKIDPRVEIFAVYLEGFRSLDGARFLEAADEIVKSGKTVILYRGGRTKAGRVAASSHTAAMAGDYAVTRALARDAGVIVADTLEDFEDLARLFVALRGRSVQGLDLGAVSNAGYETVAIADSLEPFRLARFGEGTEAALRGVVERAGLGGVVAIRNPLDLTPILDDVGYEDAVRAVLGDPEVAVGIVGCVPLTGALQTLPRGPGHDEDVARASGVAARLARLSRESRKAWVAVVDGGALYDPFVRALEEGGVPTFRAADRAMRIFGRYCEARLRQGNRAGAPLPQAHPPALVVLEPPDAFRPGVPLIWS